MGFSLEGQPDAAEQRQGAVFRLARPWHYLLPTVYLVPTVYSYLHRRGRFGHAGGNRFLLGCTSR